MVEGTLIFVRENNNRIKHGTVGVYTGYENVFTFPSLKGKLMSWNNHVMNDKYGKYSFIRLAPTEYFLKNKYVDLAVA